MPRSPWVLGALLVGGLMWPGEARAGSPYLEVPPEEEAVLSPAYRYANMTNEEAFAELDRRKIPYTREKPTHGVRAPIRLAGKLHDVWIHSSLPEAERASSPFEILDARLALALDDFALILAQHDVEELVHYTMYRPNVAPPGVETTRKDEGRAGTDGKGRAPARSKGKRRAALDGKAQKGPKYARRATPGDKRKDVELEEEALALHVYHYDAGAKSGEPRSQPGGGAAVKAGARKQGKKRILKTDEQPHGKWAPPGTRHPAGLAIDVGALKKRDGSMLHVAQHFRGKVGDKTCGTDVPVVDSPQARELRTIVCKAYDAGVFTYALTPNFDAAHADHFHLEIKPGVRWFLYH